MSEPQVPYDAGGDESKALTPKNYGEDGLPHAVRSRWTIEGITESSVAPIRWESLLLNDCSCSSIPTDALAAFYENGPSRPLYIECQNCGTGRVESGSGYEVRYEETEPWSKR